MQRYFYDVLIIGGGGAGMIAACEAAKKASRVAVVNKGYIRHSGATIMAPGAMAAAGEKWKDPEDSEDIFLKDTITGGAFMNHQEIVRTMVREIPEIVDELEEMGIIFERTEDGTSYQLRTDGGHSYRRSLYLEDHIGRELMRVLTGRAKKMHVAFHENILIFRILKQDDQVTAALGIHLQTLEKVVFECSSVVVATGGAGYAYENSDAASDLTGDGLALALDLGLGLTDMEFVQFYPLGFLWPQSLKGLFGAYINHLHLLNSEGRRFMEDYNPQRMELTTRDILSGAIMKEVLEGRGSPRGGVYADFRHVPKEVMERDMPGMCATYRSIGFDPQTESLEIAPTVHFTMGGIEVDENWSTQVGGFYAAGEACAGAHGANRVSQNALTDILVSGKMAGRHAAEYTLRRRQRPALDLKEVRDAYDQIYRFGEERQGISVDAWRERLKSVLWENVGVLRNEEGLDRAIQTINELLSTPQVITSRNRTYSPELIHLIENRNMGKVALAIALSAKERKETRGAHIRTDYTTEDNEHYLKNIRITQEDDALKVSTKEIDFTYCGLEEMV